MNPANLTRPMPSALVQDIKAASIKTQVVGAIPVKAQGQTAQPAVPVQNPITDEPASTPAGQELDRVLKEVSKDVKNFDVLKSPKFSFGHLKANNLLLPVSVAILAAVILTAVTVMAFKTPTGHFRTRSTAQADL
jgi:hypothetical protein